MKLQNGAVTANGVAAADSYHVGHMVLDFFNKPEDFVWQIDAGTGEVENKSSIKSRSIQLARCLRNAGFKPGDVIVVSGINIDVHFYAAYFNGHPIMGIDPSYKYDEIKRIFEITEPKVTFIEVSLVEEYEKVIKDLGLDTRIITLGDSDRSFSKFIKTYDDGAPDSEFRVATFDTSKVFAWLVLTSGTTGMPKVAAFKHSAIITMVKMNSVVKDKEIAPFMLLQSSVQWISAYAATLSLISNNQIRLYSSKPLTVEHIIDSINKYKPIAAVASPLIINGILEHEKHCDMTCFKKLLVTAFAMDPVTLKKLKAKMRTGEEVWNLLGQTECLGACLLPAPNGPEGNCGTDMPIRPVKLVDKTGQVITEPNKIGELWAKGPTLSEYYKNPEETKAAFSDGWFKTGDLMYRDENGYYFYVERMTSSFRYRNNLITPMEQEHVIQQHPDVVDVCVVGVPHPEDHRRAVACVMRRPGSTLTEQGVKDIISNKLAAYKQVSSVIFVDNFPRTISGKVARGKVLEYVLEVQKFRASEWPSSGNTKKLISAFQQARVTCQEGHTDRLN